MDGPGDDPLAPLLSLTGGGGTATVAPSDANDPLAPLRNLQGPKPGIVARTVGMAKDMASSIYHDPIGAAKSMVEAPVQSAYDALFTPVQGQSPATAGSRGGMRAPGSMGPVTAQNTPGSITPEREHEAMAQAGANALAPLLGLAGGLPGAVAGGALVNASYNPKDPIPAALVGGGIGAAVHGAGHVSAPETIPADLGLSDLSKDEAFQKQAGPMDEAPGTAPPRQPGPTNQTPPATIPPVQPAPAPYRPPVPNADPMSANSAAMRRMSQQAMAEAPPVSTSEETPSAAGVKFIDRRAASAMPSGIVDINGDPLSPLRDLAPKSDPAPLQGPKVGRTGKGFKTVSPFVDQPQAGPVPKIIAPPEAAGGGPRAVPEKAPALAEPVDAHEAVLGDPLSESDRGGAAVPDIRSVHPGVGVSGSERGPVPEGPGVGGEARQPTAPAAGLVDQAKFDLSPDGKQALAQEVSKLQASGFTKTYRSFAEQQVDANEFAKQVGLDPTTIDPAKLKGLSGAQIVGLKNVVSRNAETVAAWSKQLADPNLSMADAERLTQQMDALHEQTGHLLQTIVRETGDAGRNLGFLRVMARNTLDPDTWVVQAQRLAGDRILSSDEIADVRQLVNAAKLACGV